MKTRAGVVAIVGRANVGKSSLLNALAGRPEVIVAREPGTTRDRVSLKVSSGNCDFWLVDTAGLKTASDEFEATIQGQIAATVESADLILVVVSAEVPASAEDRQVAKMALKSRRPLILVINKIDKNPKVDLAEWQKLGIKPALATSATQKIGIDELRDSISSYLPPAKIRPAKDQIHLGILGRPNVGKSSIFNSLAAKQQALVARQAGTTRDTNRLVVHYRNREIELADTAGIRRPGKIERGVEQFSVLRALAAIESSDVCLLIMDAAEISTQLDQRIAGLIKDAGKGLILVVNKWDLIKGGVSMSEVAAKVAADFAFVPWAPLIFTSALSGENVTKIYELVLEIDTERGQKIKTPELNRWLAGALDQHPPAGLRGRTPKLNYMVQEADQAYPNFKIFGAHTKFLHWSYRRYLERKFRETWPLVGTPMRFWFIDKELK